MEIPKTIKIFPLVAAATIALLFYLSVHRPYLFGESTLLALLVVVAAGFIASQFETHFWTLMIAVFFWAGSGFPLASGMSLFRWVVLGAGASLSLAYYARKPNRIPFHHQHLLGLFAVGFALASAIVSVNPLMTILKSLSLVALFIYASIGARIYLGKKSRTLCADARADGGRPGLFHSRLLFRFLRSVGQSQFPRINHGLRLLAGLAMAVNASVDSP